ncbi:hypothetical protein OG465_39145 [Streptomyces sp. NBC_01367]
MGMNLRNARIARQNPSAAIRLVNDKYATKDALTSVGAPTSPTLALLRSRREVATLDWDGLPASWALKPNQSLGGNGILLAFGRRRSHWASSSGKRISRGLVADQLRRILDGEFSPRPDDWAMFEPLIRAHPDLARLSHQGLPDIRVICDGDRPRLAMLRLPTRFSGGRANLHQRAVGAAVDLSTGRITHALLGKEPTERHPDTGELLIGASVPHWPLPVLKPPDQSKSTDAADPITAIRARSVTSGNRRCRMFVSLPFAPVPRADAATATGRAIGVDSPVSLTEISVNAHEGPGLPCGRPLSAPRHGPCWSRRTTSRRAPVARHPPSVRAQSIMLSAKRAGTPQRSMNLYSSGWPYDFMTAWASIEQGLSCRRFLAPHKAPRSVLLRFARLSLAPSKLAPLKCAPSTFTLFRNAPLKSAPVQSAPSRAAPVKSTRLNTVPLKRAPMRSETASVDPVKSASVRSASLNWAWSSEVPANSAPVSRAP